MPVASARPDQNPKEMASQSGPEGPWPTGARWRRARVFYHRQGASAPTAGPTPGGAGGSASCSGHRANSTYNRIFVRSRTPKRAKLVLGASAVHVRSQLCSRFIGVVAPQNEKKAILCVKGAYCELVSSYSSLDTASEKEPAIRRVFLRARK